MGEVLFESLDLWGWPLGVGVHLVALVGVEEHSLPVPRVCWTLGLR